ncbi:oligosaccharide flippase family protein [Microbacterium sp. NPDC058062]|uniref:oligosaccharide flippase family protein n=1 Tax=Microbacterium sp. NPDC058062 TaxID=3346320 RepID=UPI0036DA407D
MVDGSSPPSSEGPSDPRRLGGHIRAHARGLSAVALATIIGILASFLAQILSARYLAPAEFGLFAAFLVIVNVAAVGSSSLQNTVTVHTAATPGASVRKKSRWPWEAIAIGLAGGIAVAAISPLIAQSLATDVAVVLAAAVSIPLSFVFADALGLLQGSGNVAKAVWWTTASQLVRVALILVTILVGAGIGGVIGAVIASIAVCLIGAEWAARHVNRPNTGAFSITGATIIVLTVAFAWLTTSDVIFLRAGAPEDVVGAYAAVTVLVRAGLIVPSTLSLYLLPRFVRNRDNPRLSRLGVLVTLGVSFATSAAMILLFALLGEWIVALLYGDRYAAAVSLLVPTALAYLPWIAAQGLLIKMTSSASKSAAAILLVAVIAQWAAFTAVIPDVAAMLWAYGIIGAVVLIVFLVIDAIHARRITARAAAR